MIRFIYETDKYNKDREIVAINVFRIAKTLLTLPTEIEVEFCQLEYIYGELLLDYRFSKRIRLDENLSSKEIIIPFLHELIHLDQVQTNRLKPARHGVIWDNKFHDEKMISLDRHIWSKLPWEVDVRERQPRLLQKLLEAGLS
jgi:hypothetical protein